MTVKKIYEQIGWNIEYETEIVNFHNRILIVLDHFISELRRGSIYDSYYPRLIKTFAFYVGDSKYYTATYTGTIYKKLTEYFQQLPSYQSINMMRLGLLLEAVKANFSKTPKQYIQENLFSQIKSTFQITPIDIGYTFTGEIIIKSGATELDETLIIKNLEWLTHYPQIRKQFEHTIASFMSKNYPDSITNAYSTLEGLVKTVLEKDRRLDDKQTRIELIKQLQLDEHWGRLLYDYSEIAHEFSSRHGRRETDKESPTKMEEFAEFYIYITGTFIRAISRFNQK